MKGIGCVLMVSGWGIVLAALVLLAGTGLRLGFVAAGIAVEFLGLGLVTYAYWQAQRAAGSAG